MTNHIHTTTPRDPIPPADQPVHNKAYSKLGVCAVAVCCRFNQFNIWKFRNYQPKSGVLLGQTPPLCCRLVRRAVLCSPLYAGCLCRHLSLLGHALAGLGLFCSPLRCPQAAYWSWYPARRWPQKTASTPPNTFLTVSRPAPHGCCLAAGRLHPLTVGRILAIGRLQLNAVPKFGRCGVMRAPSF